MAHSEKNTTRTIRECHKCPRNGKGDPYCYEVCKGPAEISEKGRNVKRLSQFESPDEFLEQNRQDNPNAFTQRTDDPAAGLDYEDDEYVGTHEIGEAAATEREGCEDRSVTEQLSDEVERALVLIIANLMSLSDTQLCIFRHIFHGEDLAKTGSHLPVPMSKQAVFKHLLTMCKNNRVVEKVIHGMMRKGQGGAKKQASQLELFDFAGL